MLNRSLINLSQNARRGMLAGLAIWVFATPSAWAQNEDSKTIPKNDAFVTLKLSVCNDERTQAQTNLELCKRDNSALERDTDPIILPLCVECEGQIDENKRLQTELDAALGAAEALTEERNTARVERDAQKSRADKAEETKAEVERKVDELDSALAEKDAALAEKDGAIADKDTALAELDTRITQQQGEINRLNRLLKEALGRGGATDGLQAELDRYRRRLAELGKTLEPEFNYYERNEFDSFLTLRQVSDLPSRVPRLSVAKCADALAWVKGSLDRTVSAPQALGLAAWVWDGTDWQLCVPGSTGGTQVRAPRSSDNGHVLIFE